MISRHRIHTAPPPARASATARTAAADTGFGEGTCSPDVEWALALAQRASAACRPYARFAGERGEGGARVVAVPCPGPVLHVHPIAPITTGGSVWARFRVQHKQLNADCATCLLRPARRGVMLNLCRPRRDGRKKCEKNGSRPEPSVAARAFFRTASIVPSPSTWHTADIAWQLAHTHGDTHTRGS